MAPTKTKNPQITNPFQKAPAMPTKKTMNLVYHQTPFHPGRMAAFAVVAVLALAIFGKVAILDQNAKRTQAYAALAEKQMQLAQITEKMAGYDELAAQYGRYSYGWMTEEEASLVDRMDVLSILESKIVPVSTVKDFAINNNVLTLNISGITLEETSKLVNRLESTPLVSKVTVYTAQADDETLQAQVFMTIILEKEVTEE